MIEAFVLVVVRPGSEEKVYNALAKEGKIKEIYRVYGEYDIILRVEVENIHELDKFHDEVLRRVSNIEVTETLIASSFRG
ncbi:Lrp/AsnC family transcriptional regulator [Thermococcus sp. MAR1]|uniref:Lrp/AsnC family transcriptional regulator n=1 Tax=Thermococcus sp. MAR1 TaxID=1638263 RepID=UPI001438C1C0|nr:Lrp/AsnC ligand binding domain-containing protein [Thermococcus sp. MAR1]NJE09695.1 Lrp/AsnC family transcriptional regulator [Thermococcus sp. MAR1]